MSKVTGHEERDVDVVSLVLIAAGLVLCGIVILLVAAGMRSYLASHEPATIAGRANLPVSAGRNFPEPRLEVRGGEALAKLRAAEESDLNSYGWIDRKAGIVRIPIARAMELLLRRGLPEVGTGQTPLSLMQARPSEKANPPRVQPSADR